MLYSSKRRFIFVHNTRCGGTAVTRALRPYASPLIYNLVASRLWRKAPETARRALGWRAPLLLDRHMTAEQAREIVPPDLFTQCFKFGFVRNPWDWTVSLYFYIKQTPAHAQHPLIATMSGFDEFVEWRVSFESGKQKSYFYDRDGYRLVDFIGRFETLEQDFARICARLGVAPRLTASNASERERDFRCYYTPRTCNLIGDFFREDIETFGYE